MVVRTVWKREKNDTIYLIQHPCSYFFPSFAYAFGRNIIITKICIQAYPSLFNMISCIFPRCLIFLNGCCFVEHLDSLTCDACEALMFIYSWFCGLIFISLQTLGAGWPLCHQSARHGDMAQQVILKEWMFLLGFTTAF